MTYVELHCHSCYSFREGAPTPEEFALRARDLGYDAVAVTDHDGLYGAMVFAQTAKAFGVRPITGRAEVTIRGDSRNGVSKIEAEAMGVQGAEPHVGESEVVSPQN